MYPSEVEAALQSIPGVARAHVVGVDQAGTTCVGAAVVLDDGEERTPEELAGDLRPRLSSFKMPTLWKIVAHGALPVMATGKIDQQALRRLLLGSTQ